MMTVQELIDALMKVKDKSKRISITNMSDHFRVDEFSLESEQSEYNFIEIIMEDYSEQLDNT